VNFSQIKCFLAAADCLSFTRAADRLYLSQPVLSRQIASMEEELGMELVVRGKKSVSLTPAGELLASGFSGLSSEYQSLVQRALALHLGYSGSLAIGMVEGQLICPPYSPALASFREKYPNAQVNLSRHSMASMRANLLDGEIDIGFAALFNVIGQNDLDYIEVGTAQTMLVIPKTHPLAGKSGLHISDFRDDTFLTLSENESPYISDQGGREDTPGGFHPKTLVAPTIGALALWLEAGFGIFPLNENHSLRNNPNLLFIPIPELEATTEIVMWRKDNKNPLIPMFINEFSVT
jgi:DNA-binding transcriptional LysR family regulator